MTPDKRLNQLEPVVADTAQKVDRLIETNSQILEIAVRGDANAELAAKGVANLTVGFNEFKREMRDFKQEVRDGFTHVDHKIDTEIGGLHHKIDTEIGGLHQKVDTEIGNLRQEMNQRFDQLVTLIQDRLR